MTTPFSPYIQSAAIETNRSLFRVVQSLPLRQKSAAISQSATPAAASSSAATTVTSSASTVVSAAVLPLSISPRQPAGEGDLAAKKKVGDQTSDTLKPVPLATARSKSDSSPTERSEPLPSTASGLVQTIPKDADAALAIEEERFDVRETVNVLTLQFLSEHEETRIAALEWLQMLHRRDPEEVRPSAGDSRRNPDMSACTDSLKR